MLSASDKAKMSGQCDFSLMVSESRVKIHQILYVLSCLSCGSVANESQLEMNDGDTLEVHQEQIGGA